MPIEVSPGPFNQTLPYLPKFAINEPEPGIHASSQASGMRRGPASIAASTIIPPNPGGVATPYRAIPALADAGYTPASLPPPSLLFDDAFPRTEHNPQSAYGVGGYGRQSEISSMYGTAPLPHHHHHAQPLSTLHSDGWAAASAHVHPHHPPKRQLAPPAESAIVPGGYSSVIAPKGHTQLQHQHQHQHQDVHHQAHQHHHQSPAHHHHHHHHHAHHDDIDRQNDTTYYARPRRSGSLSSQSDVLSPRGSPLARTGGLQRHSSLREGSRHKHNADQHNHHHHHHHQSPSLPPSARSEEHSPVSPRVNPLHSDVPPPSLGRKSLNSGSAPRQPEEQHHASDYHHHYHQLNDDDRRARRTSNLVPEEIPRRPQIRRQQSLPFMEDVPKESHSPRLVKGRVRSNSNAVDTPYIHHQKQPQEVDRVHPSGAHAAEPHSQTRQYHPAAVLDWERRNQNAEDRERQERYAREAGHQRRDLLTRVDDRHPSQSRHHQHHQHHDDDHGDQRQAPHQYVNGHLAPPADSPPSDNGTRHHHNHSHRRHLSGSYIPQPKAASYRSPSPSPLVQGDSPLPRDPYTRRRAASIHFDYGVSAPPPPGSVYDDGNSAVGSAMTFMDGAIGGQRSQYGLPQYAHHQKADYRRYCVQRGNADVYV